jgi:hypothetical protein
MKILVSELAHLLLVAAIAAWASKRVFGSDRAGRIGALLATILGVGPLAIGPEWGPSFYTRALVGEPGALGWIYLLHLLLRATGAGTMLQRAEATALALSATTGACLIFPASFGVPWAPDFYNADFGGFALPTACLAMAAFFWWRGWIVAVAGIAFGLLSYGLRLHESANLWDCLFDFPSVLVSLVILLRWMRGSLRRLRSCAGGASLAEPNPPA